MTISSYKLNETTLSVNRIRIIFIFFFFQTFLENSLSVIWLSNASYWLHSPHLLRTIWFISNVATELLTWYFADCSPQTRFFPRQKRRTLTKKNRNWWVKSGDTWLHESHRRIFLLPPTSTFYDAAQHPPNENWKLMSASPRFVGYNKK